MSKLEDIFYNSSIEEIENGYVYEANSRKYICLICGEVFEEGVIYPVAKQLLTAEKAVEIHIKQSHSSVFESLLQLEKKNSGLSDIQRELMSCFYKGLSDSEIVEREGGGSTSTIRNHRFKLREKEKQAKVFLAMMNLLHRKEPQDKRYLLLKDHLQQVEAIGAESEHVLGEPDYGHELAGLPDGMERILITDIGSTTTKALLLRKQDGKLIFAAEADVPTTVEKPLEDVKIGVRNAIAALEARSGEKITDELGNLTIPYLTTSSAGGGLQILVFGMTSSDTGKTAEMTAYGAGAVILGSFTINDGIREIEKMKIIRELHPDMILMAGGIDGGGVWGVIRLAEILSLADPDPKFISSHKIPLIFCGNINAQDYVTDLLEHNFDVHLSENIRPTMTEINTEPTRQKVHELFMENVMERAPGYAGLKNSTAADIIPTPVGVERILTLYADKHKRNILMVDIGGATTDIFSCINGHYDRTVSANVGMSYSLSNIMKQCGVQGIMGNMGHDYAEDHVRNYISNKMLNPTYLPRYDCERDIEMSCASRGIDLAWQQHLQMNFQIEHIGFLDRRKNLVNTFEFNPFEKVFKKHTVKEGNYFQLSNIDMIVGAGGVVSGIKNSDEIICMLCDGFKPSGITKLAVDRPFKSPHLGVLSVLNSGEALQLFERESLKEVGYVVAPFGKIKKGKEVLSFKMNGAGDYQILKGGDVLYLPKGGGFEIVLGNNILLVRKEKTHKFYSELPVLFDCRGRGERMIDVSLVKAVLEKKFKPFQTDALIGRSSIVEGAFEIERKLPYRGHILVKEGELVEPGNVVGRNLFNPPKIFLVDIRRLVGYEEHLTPQELDSGFMIKIGDMVKVNQKIFKAAIGNKGRWKYFRSNVRGVVEKIEKTGLVVLREKQDYNEKPVTVDVAAVFGVKPSHIEKYLKYTIGEYVEKDQIIAQSVSGGFSLDLFGGRDASEKHEIEQEQHETFAKGEIKYIHAPATGHIKDVDLKKGTVTIQYITNPVQLKAFVKGEVAGVEDKIAVTVRGNGAVVYGIIGFGGEASGEINVMEYGIDASFAGKIAVSFEAADINTLKAAAAHNVAGLIIPSINNSDWVEYHGEEIGVALTGNEEIPFSLMLTEGFGEAEMNDTYRKFLTGKNGQVASLSVRTQIRAGVTRPMVIISD